jgi:malonate-semialdehyde dehydrogenase (acetylating)/methylmalonate-semialdehyde dehydrogenase
MTGTTTRISHWIDGSESAGTSGRTAPVFNPATGQQTAEVDLASAAEVDAVVAKASAAAREWRTSSLSRRSAVLFAFRELLNSRTDELAAIITAEHGKVLSDAAGEIARGLENVEFATGVPQLLKGGFSEQAATGVDVYNIRQPLGVVAGITPFNFPAMVPLWMCSSPARRTPRRRSSSPASGRRPACRTASSPCSRATRRRSTRS